MAPIAPITRFPGAETDCRTAIADTFARLLVDLTLLTERHGRARRPRGGRRLGGDRAGHVCPRHRTDDGADGPDGGALTR